MDSLPTPTAPFRLEEATIADLHRAIQDGRTTFVDVVRAEPGREDVMLRVASAYEAASKRRIPPPAFGPLDGGV